MTVDGADNTTTAIFLHMLSATGKAQDKAQDMRPLWGADRGKYTPFLDDLIHEFLKVHNNYPATLSEAYILLLHYKSNTATYIRKNQGHGHPLLLQGRVGQRKKKNQPIAEEKEGVFKKGKMSEAQGETPAEAVPQRRCSHISPPSDASDVESWDITAETYRMRRRWRPLRKM